MSVAASRGNVEEELSVSCIGQGLVSIGQVPDLPKLTSLRTLCLHGNNINRIDSLQGLTSLVELNLSSNAIASIDPGSLRGLTGLTFLNLASNRLQSVHGLDGLSNLEQLNLSFNYITSISGLAALQGPLCKLRQLNLKHNQLHNLQAFSVLVGCINLRWLQVAGNPVCQLPNYMQALATVLSQLTQLDSLSSAEALASPYDAQAAQQYAAMQLQTFESRPGAGAAYPASPQPTTYGRAPPHPQQQQWPASQAGQGAAGRLQSGAHHRPQLPARQHPPQAPLHSASGQQAPANGQGSNSHSQQQQQQQQQQYQQPSGRYPAHPPPDHRHPHEAVAAPRPHDIGGSYASGMGVQRQPERHSAHWQGHPSGGGDDASAGGAGRAADRQGHSAEGAQPQVSYDRPMAGRQADGADVVQAPDQMPPGLPPRQQYAQPAGPLVKILSADAAVQTSEYTPLVRRLQLEAAELRQQLAKVADELERRNAAEESLRVSMQEAISAAQEDAHRKVEDGFREASFAVSKALQELESTRRAANEAQQRIAAHVKSEEEQRSRCTGLEKELGRLRDEMQRLNQQLLDQQQAASSALEDERRRAAGAEAALRDQLAAAQAVASELPVVRAAAQAAEAKVSSLEAALQQSSNVTVSMTAKIAQTMADANAQIDVLKARLATAEQQLSDHQRREVDARAEINTLTAALEAARTTHMRELDAMTRQHEEAVRAAVEKERSVAEERGRGLAALQAQQERTALQEQVAFLKAQLQFALKESDKEQLVALQSLRAAQAEASELRAALQAASAKQREGEALVADLTSVVQQQKAALQGVQREKEALAARLKACGPEAFDSLAAENLNLKRAAAERDMYREQVDDARRRWQEAERRVTELQVSSSRTAEELSARVRSAEAALAAAREEAARAEMAVEKLRAEVVAQQDIVKIKMAMLDSANDTIASLKAEIADLQVEADEARRSAEEAEAALMAREQQQRDEEDADGGEKAQLRQELQASEAAAASARSSLAEVQARLKDVEGRLRAATEAVAEKDRMIKYVEEEVDRVKGLFEKREQRLRDERDAARADTAAAAAARDVAESRLADAHSKIDRLVRDLEAARGQLEDAAVAVEEQRRAAAAAAEVAAARAAEAARLGARVAEVEGEMRLLLEAVERQKASSAHKMKQLASLLQDL